MTPPILLIIYNRPDLTLKVFDAIRKEKPTKLFIASDAARNNGEVSLIEASRQVTENVDWQCQVYRKYEEVNLGCAIGPSSAIAWAFTMVDELVILEDDCVPSPYFFHFTATLLSRYRDDQRVGAICGTSLPGTHLSESYSYSFSKMAATWGWATWKRVWQHYDFKIDDWQELRNTDWLNNCFYGNRYMALGFTQIFDTVLQGYDVWDYQFVYMCLKQDFYIIHPAKNLISNIGFDQRATHTKTETSYSNLATEKIEQLIHPPYVAPSYKGDLALFKILHGYETRPPGRIKLLWRKIRHKVRSRK